MLLDCIHAFMYLHSFSNDIAINKERPFEIRIFGRRMCDVRIIY